MLGLKACTTTGWLQGPILKKQMFPSILGGNRVFVAICRTVVSGSEGGQPPNVFALRLNMCVALGAVSRAGTKGGFALASFMGHLSLSQASQLAGEGLLLGAPLIKFPTR